ncbi:MAG: response regulator transcription factor [Coriobacteriia bacterium]
MRDRERDPRGKTSAGSSFAELRSTTLVDLGMGFLLAWVAIVYRSSRADDLLLAVDPGGAGHYFVYLAVAIVIFLGLALSKRVASLSKGTGTLLSAALMASIGSVLVLAGKHSATLVLIGAVLGGVGAPLLTVGWGRVWGRMELSRAVVCAALSAVLCSVVRLLFLFAEAITLGSTVAAAFLLPLCSFACLFVALKKLPSTATIRKRNPDFNSLPLWKLIAGLAVYSLIFGAYFGISRFAPREAATTFQSFAYIIAADLSGGVLFLVYASVIRNSLTLERLHRPVPVLMISGLALFPLLGSSLTSPPMVLVSTAWVYIWILLWVCCAERASHKDGNAVRVFAGGQLVLNAAMLAGTVAGTVSERWFGLTPSTLTVIALALVYALAMTVNFLFSSRRTAQRRLVVDAEASVLVIEPSSAEAGKATVIPYSHDPQPLRCTIAVAAYGLSKREADVLPLLARGFNASSIAEKLSISRNTAKTHIQHIYEKLNVTSQQELVKTIDRLDVDASGSVG